MLRLIVSMINVSRHAVKGWIINGITHKSSLSLSHFMRMIFSVFPTVLAGRVFYILKERFERIYGKHTKNDGCHDQDVKKEHIPNTPCTRDGNIKRNCKSDQTFDGQCDDFSFLHNTLNTMKYMTYLISEWGLNVNIFSTIHITKIGDKT